MRVVTPITCGSANATFVANVLNGVPNPGYQWSKDGGVVMGATNSTFTTTATSLVDCRVSPINNCFSSATAYTKPGGAVVQPILCYGEPIRLLCNYTQGCNNPDATFQWENSSGSWTSTLRDPVIYPPGAMNPVGTGYCSDVFFVTMEYAPPPGGHEQGWVCTTVLSENLISSVTTDVSCFGICDGSINTTITGGTPSQIRNCVSKQVMIL